MSERHDADVIICGKTYRYQPNGTGYCYMGPDNLRYRRHANGGGLVGQYAIVWDIVSVGPNCLVFGGANLRGGVVLKDSAQVGGTVRATGHVTFAEQAFVTEGEFSSLHGLLVTEPHAQ
jgi:hypothetical protein